MKALLLADLYQSKKHCRNLLLAVVIFVAVAIFYIYNEVNNFFFPLYAMLMAGLTSMSLLAYDEQSHWDLYAQALPTTRRQQVSVKYVDSLICAGFVWLLFAAAYAVMTILGKYSWGDTLVALSVLLMVGLLSPAILLPVVFRYGVTKGRLVYFVVIIAGASAGAGVLTASTGENSLPALLSLPNWLLGLLGFAAALALFAGSWRLAVRWYEKREL